MKWGYKSFNPFLDIYSFQHIEEKTFRKTLWEKVKLLKMKRRDKAEKEKKLMNLFLETGKSAVETPLHSLTQLFKNSDAKYGQHACGNIWNE